MEMEAGLKEGVKKSTENEKERNKTYMFKKEGTKNREKAEAELRIGTWAIEETRRALPYKKPDMMGIVTSTETDSNTGPKQDGETPLPTTRLYPELPTEPPPYTQGPTVGGKSLNPFRTGPFTPPPAVQAPVFAVKGGELMGSVTMGVKGGHLVCEEVEEEGEGSEGISSLMTMPGGKYSSTPRPFTPDFNPQHYVRCGFTSPKTSLVSRNSHDNLPSENEEGGTSHTPRDMEIDNLRREVNESLALAKSLIEKSEKEGGTFHVEGVMTGKITDLVDPVRKSVRLENLRAQGVTSRTDWDQNGGYSSAMQLPLRPTTDPRFEEYQPWKMTDLTTLMEQLPSLHGGASAWLLQLQTLTSGLRLCLGDMKALLARATDHVTMSSLVKEADLDKAPPTAPLEDIRQALWGVLRRAYPTEKNHATLSSFTITPGEQPAAYLDRAKTTWRTVHEEPYDHTETTLSMWKEMVVNGCPGEVKVKLRNTVGLMALPLPQFNSHTHHHLTQYYKDKGGADTQVQSLQVQLLKLQLKEAQKGDKKKQMMEKPEDLSQVIEKTITQMMQQQQTQPTPIAEGVPQVMQPMPQPMPMAAPGIYPPPQLGYPTPWMTQPAYPTQWRGGQWRGGGLQCYNCRQHGHMARNCPQALTQSTQQWLANRGSSQFMGRGRGGPRPQRYPGPQPHPAYNHANPDPGQQSSSFQGMADEYAPWP